MAAFLDAFKTLKLWQIGVLIAVLAGAGGTTYGVYALVSGSGQTGLSEDQQLIPVQYGNLVNQVSTKGSLIFPIRELLTFGTQGTVEEVLAEEGQQVEEGQPLAKLDGMTVATLAKAVAQARVNLRDAEDALVEAKNPHTPLGIAEAESAIANAKLSLNSTQDALNGLLEPTALDLAEAESAVTTAKISVENASEVLDTIKAGPTADDIAKAQSDVGSADTTLAIAVADLSLARKEWDDTAQGARDSLNTALEDYQNVYKKWLGIDLGEGEVDSDPGTLLDSWGVDLASLFDPGLRDGVRGAGVPLNDTTTPWNETVVYTWQTFYFGTILANCEDGVVPPQGLCVKKEMDDAWNTYQGAKEDLDTVQIQAAKAIASVESTVTNAEESLATTQEALTDLQEGPNPLEIESKDNQLQVDRATLQTAEEKLAELLGDPSPLELEAKQKQVTVAQANLATSEEDLAELQGSVNPLEVALRETEVASVQLALEEAMQRLEGAVLKAPMAGIVSLVNVEAGQAVNANTPIIEVVDPTVVEVDGIVDEIDVLFVREGALAAVTMDALPGQVLEGVVSAIASAAQSQQGVVSYPISIQVQLPEGVQLREGLSATASIVIREESDVLLVPLQALYGSFEQPVVRVSINGRIEERPVILGNSDDFWVAVREGLTEGEQVVMETTQTATSQFGFGSEFRRIQGQFSGAFSGGRGGFGVGGQRQQGERR